MQIPHALELKRTHYLSRRRIIRIAILCSFFIIIIFLSSTFFLNRSQKYDIVSTNFSDCPLCSNLNQSSETSGNSTPNDLVLCGVFGKEKLAFPFIRTLRSVGCKAHVVFVSNKTMKNKHKQFFKKCGVELFIMVSPKNTNTMYPHSLRYIGYQQYLKQTKYRFNRILHADSFDVFFQKDPFNENISTNSLNFVLEDILIINSSWNSGWLQRAYGEEMPIKMGNNIVSCSGTIIGGAKQFKIYLNTLLGHKPFWLNGRHSLDQAYHNYLLYSKKFERNGIKPKFFSCNSPILTMHYCFRRGNEHYTNERVLCPDGRTVPSIVHQYNLFEDAQYILHRICPKLKKI